MNNRLIASTRVRYGIAAVALAGAAAVAVSSASAGSPAAGVVEHADVTALTARANRTVDTILARGSAPTAGDIVRLKASPAVTSGNGDVSRARAITPPAGADKGQPWYLVPSADASGRVCLDAGATGVACGTAALVATTGLATTRIDNPNSDANPWGPGGTAHTSGIVPPDVTEVVAVDTNGVVSKRVAVTGQAYELDVATENLGSLEFRDASGDVLGVVTIRS